MKRKKHLIVGMLALPALLVLAIIVSNVAYSRWERALARTVDGLRGHLVDPNHTFATFEATPSLVAIRQRGSEERVEFIFYPPVAAWTVRLFVNEYDVAYVAEVIIGKDGVPTAVRLKHGSD